MFIKKAIILLLCITTFAYSFGKLNDHLIKVSKKEINKLVKDNRIHKSWLDAKILKIEKISINGKKKNIITFENLELKQKKYQKLYIKTTLNGNRVIAITHSYKSLF